MNAVLCEKMRERAIDKLALAELDGELIPLREKAVYHMAVMASLYPDVIARMLKIEIPPGVDEDKKAVYLLSSILLDHADGRMVQNPAVPFTHEAATGRYDNLPDEEYKSRLELAEKDARFWRGRETRRADEVFRDIVALADMEYLEQRRKTLN